MDDITLNNGQVIEVEGADFHKYWKQQGVYNNGSVFIMKDEFDKEYTGYVIKHEGDTKAESKLAFFWHETVAKFGVEDRREGYFGNKPFIRISLTHKDGTGKSQ